MTLIIKLRETKTVNSQILLNFALKHFLNQCVSNQTRGNIILDLFLKNNEYLVTNFSSNITDLSDHNMTDRKDCVPLKKISKTGKPRSLHALQRKKVKLKTRLQAAELGRILNAYNP